MKYHGTLSIVIPLVLASIIGGCKSYLFAASRDSLGTGVEKINLDSSQVDVPSEFRRPYVVGNGVLFGILGFFAGGYLAYTWGNGLKIGGKCEDCHSPGLFWIGVGVGFIGGYILGAQVGSRVAKIKHSEQLSQNTVEENKASVDSTQNITKKAIVLLSVGTNFSSYLHEEGQPRIGYNLGLTFNIPVYKNLSITLPFSYARINAAPERVAGRSYSYDLAEKTPNPVDYYIYKLLVNRKISIGFVQFPILLSYKFLPKEKYDFSYMLGAGLVIAATDFSTPTQPKDVTITDEIIGTYDTPPIDPTTDETFTLSNSGLTLNSGIRFHFTRFYIDLLYALYPYTIKDINKLNTLSLSLGIDLE